jgi:hypothetical protein
MFSLAYDINQMNESKEERKPDMKGFVELSGYNEFRS